MGYLDHSDSKNTPLFYSIKKNNLEIFEYILGKSPNLEHLNTHSESYLNLAVSKNLLHIVR